MNRLRRLAGYALGTGAACVLIVCALVFAALHTEHPPEAP